MTKQSLAGRLRAIRPTLVGYVVWDMFLINIRRPPTDIM